MKLVEPHLRRAAGEFPPGWNEWVAREERSRTPALPPEALASVFAQRDVAPPSPHSPELGRWESLKALYREQWDPPPADERPVRRIAWVVAVGWHLFVALMLVWLMYQQYVAPANPPKKGEEEVVQIEFLGEGTPDEVGGGPDVTPSSDDAAAASAPASGQDSAAAEPPAAQAPSQTLESAPEIAASEPPPVPRVTPDLPVPEPTPPEVSQNVEVSKPVPDVSEYQLPPPMPRLPLPQVTVPERTVSAPDAVVVEVPSRPATALPTIAPRPIPEIALEPTPSEVVVREIAAPLPAAPTVVVPRREVAVAEQPLTPRALREREIPAPSPATAVQPAQSRASDTATAARSDSSSPSERKNNVSTGNGNAAATPAQTTGPKAAAARGGWDTLKRADDWGDSTRNVEGGQKGDPSGLYNSDGSVRLAETPGSASPARPPGALTDEIVNLDRAGTWLKRKPTDYEPTAFDRYWRPSETLLEEWVRKSVTTVRIPIPGTNKHVVCQTILLVVGGACDITDPNLLDVAATARPAPDIPFKPELQEGNGSLPEPVEE